MFIQHHTVHGRRAVCLLPGPPYRHGPLHRGPHPHRGLRRHGLHRHGKLAKSKTSGQSHKALNDRNLRLLSRTHYKFAHITTLES